MVCAYLRTLVLLLIIQTSVAQLKKQVSLSPKFVLEPGLVSDKYYFNIDFPRGHIAIKSFDADIIDEKGNSIPLHETYLHHWVVVRYYQRIGLDDMAFPEPENTVPNSGVCEDVPQYFGLGSDTRGTKTDIPDPYGIEVGNPEDIPQGYEEHWLLNVHAIDTRGAEDKLGCTECRCDLYNVTVYEGYIGGYRCCHDGRRCRVKDGFQGVKRSLHLKYTVNYLDWDSSIVPVKIYRLDVMDTWTKADESKGLGARHLCLIEYDVEPCPTGIANDECTHEILVTVSLPTGGDLIYGVAHQHAGGIGTTLYGEGGREICSSNPIYGRGDEPGNEAGYIVGMSTCYPSPGSVKISAGETLTFVSKYNSTKKRTGVMGFYHLLIADPLVNSKNVLHAPTDLDKHMKASNFGLTIAIFGAVLIAVVIFLFQSRSGRYYGSTRFVKISR